MTTADCISDDRLRLLLLGELSEDAAAPLESHLLDCPECVARTRTLQSSDTLVAALQQAGASALSCEAASSIDRIVQKLSDRSASGTHSSLLDPTAVPGAAGNVQTLIALLEPAAEPDELGRLGGFRILKLLGEGGMGAVFLAEDIQLRRHVALKLLRPSRSAQSDAVERFKREARAAAAVRHDNVVTIYQVGETHGIPFIAQELLEGETLDERLKHDGRMSIADTLRFGREIASGLAAAHGCGLIHRDIKPSNIWIEQLHPGRLQHESAPWDAAPAFLASEPPSRVKILDFGLVRMQEDDAQLTQLGAVVGTPTYMAPEQARGDTVDSRCDLFSLGCVLYRMLAGQVPFRGKDTVAFLKALARHAPQPVSELRANTPPALGGLVARLLAKEPSQRPQSAADVAATLSQIERDLASPVAASKPPIETLQTHPAADLADTLLPPQTNSAFGAVSPIGYGRLAIVAVACLALAAVLGIFITVRTPFGEVVVDLGEGVKPEDVKIELKGDEEVKIADADHGWTIDVRQGRYVVELANSVDRFDIDRNTITVSRNQKTHLKVTLRPVASAEPPANPAKPVATARPQENPALKPVVATGSTRAQSRPVYENDFSRQEPPWPLHNNEALMVRNGCFVIQEPRPDRAHWSGAMPWLETADIEIVGRATSGSWGFQAIATQYPSFGIAAYLNAKGEVEAWRLAQASKNGPSGRTAMTVRSKPLRHWKGDGGLNVMRAVVRDGRVNIWVNGEEACEPIRLLDPLPLMTIGMAGRSSATDFKGFHCEFDSIRIWRAGEGPPLGAAATAATGSSETAAQPPDRATAATEIPAAPLRPAGASAPASTPIYQHDFSVPDLPWRVPNSERFMVRNGCFVIRNSEPNKWNWSGGMPWLEAADFEAVGRATTGSWGFVAMSPDYPSFGLKVCLNGNGELQAWRLVQPTKDAPRSRIETPVESKPLRSWKGGGEFNVLRALVRGSQVDVWVNGEKACESIKLPDPLPVVSIGLAGCSSETDATGYHAEFDSIRVWRAGEGPPLAIKPLYAVDFSLFDKNWVRQSDTFEAGFRDAWLSLKGVGMGWRSHAGQMLRAEDDVDLEVVGRAASGQWGFLAVNPAPAQLPHRGLLVTVDGMNQINAWHTTSWVPGTNSSSAIRIALKSRREPAQNNGAFGNLRASFRGPLVSLWLDGERACDDIRLDESLRPIRVLLAGHPGDKPFDGDFQSLRVWRAGEGPPLPRAAK